MPFNLMQSCWLRCRSAVLFAALAGLLTACAQTPEAPVVALTENTPEAADKQKEAPPAEKETPPLTEERFYEILLADIALQRDDPVLATKTFLRIAEDTEAPWFAQRAAESALAARDNTLLKDSLELWQTLDPQAERPQRLRQQLARFALSPLRDEADEARIRITLADLLRDAVTTDNLGAVFLQVNSALRQISDKKAAFEIVQELALPYPQQPEAHYAIALASYLAASEKAMTENRVETLDILREGKEAIDSALVLEPEWDEAMQLKSLLLDRMNSDEMLPWLLSVIEEQPDKKSLWPFVARAYVKQKNYEKAREWFLKVWRDNGSDDALIAAAALSMEMKDHQATVDLLEEVRQSNMSGKANELVKTYARISEDEGHIDEAIYWYKQVTEDEHWWDIQMYIAQLLIRSGKNEEAAAWLDDLPAVTLEERISVIQMRSVILRNNEDWDKAEALLKEAVAQFPRSAELQMNLALIEERQGKIDSAISRLRKALELNPNDPYVQNGLGYTLVDHQIQIEEGAALIEKAHKAMPEDGAILDSMGWALYRLGKLEESLPYLRKAIRAQPDGEVAAHLGEVLWQLGRLDEARQIWKNSLQGTSKDTLIHETMKRLNAGDFTSESPPASAAP